MKSKMRNVETSRRSLLHGLGASLLAAPLLGGREVRGQTPGATSKNLVVVTWPEGLEAGWQPSGSGTTFELGAVLEPFRPFKDQLLIVNGLKSGYNIFESLLAHNLGTLSLWTGARSKGVGGLKELSASPSIDQLVAQRIGGESAFASLHFGTQTNRDSFISTPFVHFSGPEQPVPAEDDPNVMFDQIFGGALAQDAAAIDQLKLRRASVLDFVRSDVRQLETQLGASDRPKLQAHLAGVEAIEKNLANLGMGCSSAPPSAVLSRAAALADENFPAVIQLQTDLLVTALQCELTRVATLQLSNTDSQVKIPNIATNRSVHEAQHSGTVEDRTVIGKFFVKQLAYLLERLRSVQVTPERTLLDDTLVVMGSEMGIGTHTPDPVPFFIAGGGNAHFKLGRYLSLAEPLQHTRLLTSVLHAMGSTDVAPIGGDFKDEGAIGPLPDAQG